MIDVGGITMMCSTVFLPPPPNFAAAADLSSAMRQAVIQAFTPLAKREGERRGSLSYWC